VILSADLRISEPTKSIPKMPLLTVTARLGLERLKAES
jgi:hypothetical protein